MTSIETPRTATADPGLTRPDRAPWMTGTPCLQYSFTELPVPTQKEKAQGAR